MIFKRRRVACLWEYSSSAFIFSAMPSSSADFERTILASFEEDLDSAAILEKNASAIAIGCDGLTRRREGEGGRESGVSEAPEREVVLFAVACVHRFVRQNFTGPPDASDAFPALASMANDPSRTRLREDLLSFGLNRPFVNCRELELLWAAKLLLLDNETLVDGFESADWWAIRALLVWQKVLDEPSIELKTSLERRAQRWLQSTFFLSLPPRQRAQFWIEYAYGLLYYFEFDKAGNALEEAMSAVGIEVDFIGALGKRTRFQERDIAQLLLQVALFCGLKC